MNRWMGLLGVVVMIAAALLIRIPQENEQGVDYTGLLTSENVRAYHVMVRVVPPDNTTIGVALQDYELDFGILPQGTTARKSISLDSDVPVRVRLWSDGNVSGILKFSNPDFVLEGTGSVELIMSAPDQGYYEGNVYISSRSPRLSWLRGLVPWI